MRAFALTLMLAVGLGAATPAIPRSAGEKLPGGIILRETADGLALASAAGEILYAVDFDNGKSQRRAELQQARCADICAKYWRPVMAPAGFTPRGKWSSVSREGGALLAYEGVPLYRFTGKSLAVLNETAVAPPYFNGYSKPPIKMIDGVPHGTRYWKPVLYRPDAPQIIAPAGITAFWTGTRFVLAAEGEQILYAAPREASCSGACDGLTALRAPMAAQPLGQWRPADDASGIRRWTYRGKSVYRGSKGLKPASASGWQPLGVD